jgi:hypothetical protein
MSAFQNIPNIERLTFFNGQRLTAEDLTAVQNANKDLRWLHNRSLHGWGIGSGYSVEGETGASSVQIGPGYAIDCLGREIILTDPIVKTVPAVGGALDGSEATFYLVAAYLDDSGQQVLESRPGVCLPGGTVRLTETPNLSWKSPTNLGPSGSEVLLAQIWVLNCQLSRPVSLAVRRFARISSQPYIVSDETPVNSTAWQLWQPDASQPAIGIFTNVDTSAAQFHSTPAYTAYIAGNRVWQVNADIQVVALLVVSVVNASEQGFTLQGYLLPDQGGKTPQDWLTVANDPLQWHVVWLGVEG